MTVSELEIKIKIKPILFKNQIHLIIQMIVKIVDLKINPEY